MRGDQLLQTVDPIEVPVALDLWPARREDFVRDAAEEKEFDLGELVVSVLLALVIEIRRCPRRRRFDYPVKGDETRHDQLSHERPSFLSGARPAIMAAQRTQPRTARAGCRTPRRTPPRPGDPCGEGARPATWLAALLTNEPRSRSSLTRRASLLVPRIPRSRSEENRWWRSLRPCARREKRAPPGGP